MDVPDWWSWPIMIGVLGIGLVRGICGSQWLHRIGLAFDTLQQERVAVGGASRSRRGRATGSGESLARSDTAYHRPLSCSPSPSWWNILATGAQPTSIVRGNGITPVAELAGQELSSPVRRHSQRLSPPRTTGALHSCRCRGVSSGAADEVLILRRTTVPLVAAETFVAPRRAHQSGMYCNPLGLYGMKPDQHACYRSADWFDS
jgi:hypothetical protein